MIKYATILKMMENTPVITVTCARDLPMLELQAQSIHNFLSKDCPVFIIVNEDDTDFWQLEFDKNIKHYYQHHKLTIIYKSEFQSNWSQWIPSIANPWSVGWETQQILKLAISEKIHSPRYLVLDSQNFLIKHWDPSVYPQMGSKVPARPGNFVMPVEIWNQYSESLDISLAPPTDSTMSMCTPIFFKTKLVKTLIEHAGGIVKFTNWFKNASKIKSEFILYLIWAEKQNGFERHHYMIDISKDWANPYLRDCRTEEEFNNFVSFVGVHDSHAWISINHRAWGNMTQEQYKNLSTVLSHYNLTPKFEQYRSEYVDIKI